MFTRMESPLYVALSLNCCFIWENILNEYIGLPKVIFLVTYHTKMLAGLAYCTLHILCTNDPRNVLRRVVPTLVFSVTIICRKWSRSKSTVFCGTQCLHSVKTRLHNTPSPILYSVKHSDVTWKQGYIRPPPPPPLILHCIGQLGENKGCQGHWVSYSFTSCWYEWIFLSPGVSSGVSRIYANQVSLV